MRIGELPSLRWEAVDFNRRVLTVINSAEFTTKSKRNRVLPMTDGLFQMLQRRREVVTSETPLVFHEQGRALRDETVSKVFKRYVRKAGLPDRYHFHTLRHTFASWLAQDGVSLYAIQKLLGHSSSAVTQVYSHLERGELHGVVERIKVPLN
jgi:site-specific recombinase XerD